MTHTWPRLMKRKTAASYCDMPEAAFLREVAAGNLPTSREIGRREYWDRAALDAAIDAMMGNRSDMPEYEREFWTRHGKAA